MIMKFYKNYHNLFFKSNFNLFIFTYKNKNYLIEYLTNNIINQYQAKDPPYL